ncbi:MAG: type II secretion system protein [bacterium]
MIRLLRSKRGFTLVEIMIVVAIIGLLAAIAIPNFIKSRSRSRDAVCVNGMKQIASALEQVCMEEDLDATGAGAGIASITWNAAPATGTWGIVGSTAYLKTAPTCPIASGAYTAASSTVGVFQITCPSLTSHGPNFQATNNPYTLQ